MTNEAHELTKNQALVLGALSGAEEPLSAYTILDRLRDDGFRAPLQVYRALDKLQEYGLVHRLDSLNAFVACSRPHEDEDGMIAFAICVACGHVSEIADDEIEDRLRRVSGRKGFQLQKSTIELRGLCGSCAAA